MTEQQLLGSEIAVPLAVSVHSLYLWIKRYTKLLEQRVQEDDQSIELCLLRTELKRVTEERDILKRPPRTFQGVLRRLGVTKRLLLAEAV